MMHTRTATQQRENRSHYWIAFLSYKNFLFRVAGMAHVCFSFWPMSNARFGNAYSYYSRAHVVRLAGPVAGVFWGFGGLW